MKIAQVAPLYESVPPRFYGGTERVVAYIVDELVYLGHDVTLFASGESKTKARLVSSRDRAVWRDQCPHRSEMAAHMSMLHEVRAQAEEFDIIHFHLEILPCPIFEAVADRTLTTMHGRLDYQDYQRFFRYWSQYPLASISNSQRSPLAFANWAGTVYHGLPSDHLRPTFNSERGYLAFLGRICPEKRPDVAIRLAQRMGKPMKVAANVQPENVQYFREKVEPLLDQGSAELIGEVGDADKSAFLGNAEALIFPINWPEPFGLVMIEAMACGTPVVAWNHGSVPEIIEDGVTGFIVDNEQEAEEALEKVGDLDRRRIRAEFEHRFTAGAMARDYVRLYETLRGNHE